MIAEYNYGWPGTNMSTICSPGAAVSDEKYVSTAAVSNDLLRRPERNEKK